LQCTSKKQHHGPRRAGRGSPERFIIRKYPSPAGESSAYITEGEFDPNDVEYELMFPIEGEAHAEPPLKIKKLPAGEVASIIHRGPFDGIGAAYDTLFKWINQQGLSPAGYAREVHLRCPHNTTDPKGLVTEIQVPVRPSS